MNQILVTQKLYVTPELKKKKKMYKVNFIISIIAIIVLMSYYVYAEYDRNKDSNISGDILSAVNEYKENKTDNSLISKNGDSSPETLVVSLQNDSMTIDDATTADASSIENLSKVLEQESSKADNNNDTANNTEENVKKIKVNGKYFYSIGTIQIPKIKVEYPILAQSNSEEEEVANLKVSPVKFYGANINEVGNLCIAGHNYRNSRFFSKVPNLEYGDVIKLTDINGNLVNYTVYDIYTVDPSDISCIDQETNGKREVTLITCTNDSKLRVIVKATEAK